MFDFISEDGYLARRYTVEDELTRDRDPTRDVSTRTDAGVAAQVRWKSSFLGRDIFFCLLTQDLVTEGESLARRYGIGGNLNRDRE